MYKPGGAGSACKPIEPQPAAQPDLSHYIYQAFSGAVSTNRIHDPATQQFLDPLVWFYHKMLNARLPQSFKDKLYRDASPELKLWITVLYNLVGKPDDSLELSLEQYATGFNNIRQQYQNNTAHKPFKWLYACMLYLNIGVTNLLGPPHHPLVRAFLNRQNKELGLTLLYELAQENFPLALDTLYHLIHTDVITLNFVFPPHLDLRGRLIEYFNNTVSPEQKAQSEKLAKVSADLAKLNDLLVIKHEHDLQWLFSLLFKPLRLFQFINPLYITLNENRELLEVEYFSPINAIITLFIRHGTIADLSAPNLLSLLQDNIDYSLGEITATILNQMHQQRPDVVILPPPPPPQPPPPIRSRRPN